MDQMHEIDLELNDLRNIYLLPAPLWHCTFAFTHDFLSLLIMFSPDFMVEKYEKSRKILN